ncbi:MAG: phosphoadenosine phosphosulfate reductase [gamma proteobacterium symbiont of Ctena orbiculata]|nr:MAG: phosphoadenosine phosphosulfate reductase [gamma proteobacterium symbiont of Ctena orbiculata]
MSPLEALKPQQQALAGDLEEINRKLEGMSAEQRVEWALHYLPGNHIMTSSFGIQGALMLHLVSRILPDIPVVLVDTGYLFPETYSFIDQLSERLQLNLQVYRAPESPAWQESRYGRLWEQGLGGIEHYNRINKVEPLQRALKQLDAGSWFAGLRRQQSQSRSTLPVVRVQDGRFKVHPVIDWHNRDVHRYLQKHNLPYHPLWEQGYASVGDVHTSRPLELGMHEEETRFFGLKRECGIHE